MSEQAKGSAGRSAAAERHVRLRQTHAPAPLATLLNVTGMTVAELLALAEDRQWSNSNARTLATEVAGPRVPAQDRLRYGRQRLSSMWPWIDGLDAIEMEAGGSTRKEIARAQGYVPGTVSARIGRIYRSADAEAERAEVMSRRLLNAFGAA